MISVVIPLFNKEQIIEKTIKSVLSQDYDNFEVVVVNDGSTDGSVEIVKAIFDSRITLIEQENGGLSAARNSGVKTAKGDYLYFLDSDDELTPDALEVMYRFVEAHPQVDLVQGGFFEKKVDAGKPTPYNLPEYTEDTRLIKNILLTFDGDLIKAQSRLVRRDFFIENNNQIGYFWNNSICCTLFLKHITVVGYSNRISCLHNFIIPNKIN